MALTQRSDILLNVFLAIAVDKLADAESLATVEKEEENEEVLLTTMNAWRVTCLYVLTPCCLK